MSLDLSAPLPASSPMPAISPTGLPQKTAADYPTKFEEVAPGSTILVSGRGVETPFQATVLDTYPEYGPSGIPALYVIDEQRQDWMITASGLYSIQVLVDARQIAASIPTPADAVRVQTIVRRAEALQFKGGLESAQDVVRWAIGSTTFRYVAATDQIDEHLVQSGVNGREVWPGDWILKHETGLFEVVSAKTFPVEYEEL